LLATLCLTIAVLLGSMGTGYALPPCPEKGLRHNCIGTTTYANGDKYIGEWRDGNLNGQGTYTSANSQIKKGIWKDGKFQQPR